MLDAVASAVNVEKTALKAVGSVGRNDGVQVTRNADRRAAGVRLGDRSSTLFRQFAVLDEGSRRQALHARGLRPRPARARRGAARPLHGRRDGGQLRRASRSTSRLDSSSAELLRQVQLLLLVLRHQVQALRRPARRRDDGLLPDGHGGRREYPVQPMHSLRISRASRVALRARDRLPSGQSRRRTRSRGSTREVGVYRDELTDEVASIEPAGDEDVFDLTEDATHHFVANGLVVHNCSEYMFLDDTACNLASLNLVKFLARGRQLRRRGLPPRLPAVDDRARDQRADGARSRAPPIAQKSCDFRTLGLGYANLGTLLMLQGIPYDSREAAAICGAHHRDHARRGLRHVRGDGARARALPRLPDEPRADAARHPQPPPRRLQRAGRRSTRA